MTKGGSKNMIITVETETGKVLKVVDENGNEGERVGPKEIEEIYNSEAGFKHVGLVLHAHSSPGCLYYLVAGWYIRFCVPQ